MNNPTLSEQHRCKGYKLETTDGTDYDCEYAPDFSCDECYFVVSEQSNDKRKGKRPWAKSNQG